MPARAYCKAHRLVIQTTKMEGAARCSTTGSTGAMPAPLATHTMERHMQVVYMKPVHGAAGQGGTHMLLLRRQRHIADAFKAHVAHATGAGAGHQHAKLALLSTC